MERAICTLLVHQTCVLPEMPATVKAAANDEAVADINHPNRKEVIGDLLLDLVTDISSVMS